VHANGDLLRPMGPVAFAADIVLSQSLRNLATVLLSADLVDA
jgi:hypothetical protein